MTEVRRSLVWSAALSYIGICMQLASTVVLSRVLTPGQVGVFAIASVFTALAVNLRDFGISEYVIQVKELTDDRYRASFTANLLLSWVMGGAIYLAAGPTAGFYGDAGIAEVMQVQALSFLFIPFGAINMAWCRRTFSFKPIFYAGVVADLVSFVISTSLAMHGWGAVSLAWASLAGTITTVIVYQYFRPRHMPGWPGVRGLREVLKFGVFASGMNLLNQLGRSAPEIIIGKFGGITEVALYSRAGGLVQMFRQMVVRAVMPVCLPYFAKSVREEDSVLRAYALGVAIFSTIGWTFIGFSAIATFPAIRLIYGDQWMASIPLARILCAAGMVEVVHYLAKDALLSHGKVQIASRLQLLQQVAQLLGLMAVIPFGLPGACWGLLAASVMGLALSQWHLYVGIGLRLHHLRQACRLSALTSAGALAPALIMALAVPATEANYVWHLLISGASTVLCWLLALRLFGHPLWVELTRACIPLACGLVARFKRQPSA